MDGSASRDNQNCQRLVQPASSGIGFPYAPENWPNPGDNWGWRVGKRISSEGHHLDRYLILPTSFHSTAYSADKGSVLRSKAEVERYINNKFPDADLNAFFSTFQWRIPASPSNAIANAEPVPIDVHDGDSEVDSSNERTTLNVLYISSDLEAEGKKIAAEVDQILLSFLQSHVDQYKIALEAFTLRKNRIISLYEQLKREKEALAQRTSGELTFLPNGLMDVIDKIKTEVGRLMDVKEAVNGVGKSSIDTLRELLGENLGD